MELEAGTPFGNAECNIPAFHEGTGPHPLAFASAEASQAVHAAVVSWSVQLDLDLVHCWTSGRVVACAEASLCLHPEAGEAAYEPQIRGGYMRP